MLKYFISLLLLFKCVSAFSQGISNEYESDFAWHIKQVDEFIERFNNNDKTLVKLYSKKHNPPIVLTRGKLLKSLFNASGKNWNVSDIVSFINEVNSKKKPTYIDFFDKGWCAKLNCTVDWKGKPEHALLTLKIKKFPDESSKWMITGVNAKFLKQQRLTDSLANHTLRIMPAAKNHTTSLHPFSHATSFINITQVSKDRINIENYFEIPSVPESDELLTFVNEIVNNRLLIKGTVSLSYEFYQVKGWTFEVRQYERQSQNSGWLISKLTRRPI